MNDEMPNILTQHESGNSHEIIVRLSEPYQKTKCDFLPKINHNSNSDYDEMSEKKKAKHQEQSVEIVEEWFNKQKYIEEEKEEEMQNDDKEKIEVKEAINLRIVFDEKDLDYISPLQRDVLEFLFKEFNMSLSL